MDVVPQGSWPDSFDVLVLAVFLAAVVAAPAIGYVFMVLDIRAYLRSLRRALVCVVNYFPDLPDWVRAETPRPIAALGLRLPCTEEEVKEAYRKKVKSLHPDHGGDERRFLLFQAHFEEALKIVREQGVEYRAAANWSARQRASSSTG
ncbi:MAG: hypothetical protein ACYC35_24050 [Pirellulales bacterium]